MCAFVGIIISIIHIGPSTLQAQDPTAVLTSPTKVDLTARDLRNAAHST